MELHSLEASASTEVADDRAQAISLVDCDVHPIFAKPWKEALAPYMPPASRERIARGMFEIPFNHLYPLPQGPLRKDLMAPDLPPPGTDQALAGQHLFDDMGIDRAILLNLQYLGTFPEGDVAATIASASNEYFAENWLAKDSRWRGAIEVGWQNPDLAVKEIERWAGSKQWASIFITPAYVAMGSSHFEPIYEAAEHYGLPIQLHTTGATGMYRTGPGMAAGMPLNHLEFRIHFTQPDQIHLASMVTNGIFVRHPKLKLVVTEDGFAWLPHILWSMDAFWRGNREVTPWLTKPPSEYVYDNVRLTTQPFIEPDLPQHTEAMFEMVHAERTLMFASDYPHWDTDDASFITPEIPERFRQRVLAENAIETFGDRIL